MDGKDNYEVDRAAGEAWTAIHPEVFTMAKEARRFLIRVVRFLAEEAGIRHFLDIGTGLPTMQNTHEVAQGIIPTHGSSMSTTTMWCWRMPKPC